MKEPSNSKRILRAVKSNNNLRAIGVIVGAYNTSCTTNYRPSNLYFSYKDQ